MGHMGHASSSLFSERLFCGTEWRQGVADSSTQQQTFHNTPPRGTGRRGELAVILLLLKHIEEKQHIGLWQEEQKISMTAGSNTPLTIWKLGPLSFHERFFFFFKLPFFPSSLSTSLYCCSNSCPAITTEPTPLISLPSFVLSRPSSRPRSINLLFLHFRSHGLAIYVHPPHVSPSQLQDPQILLCGNSVMLLPHCLCCPTFAWCPAALGKDCVPGWIPGCVVLISPEWTLHHYWSCLFLSGQFYNHASGYTDPSDLVSVSPATNEGGVIMHERRLHLSMAWLLGPGQKPSACHK